MVAFSRLPDACLLALFKQLPPEDQLRARSVCRKWDSLIPVAASTRRSLIIFLGGSYPRNYRYVFYPIGTITSHRAMTNEDGSPMFPRELATIWNSLHFPRLLKKDNWRLIPTTFTGVEHLQGIFTSKNPKNLTLFAILLELWRHQLTSFHFFEHCEWPEVHIPAATSRRLYAAINSLPHLKRLVFYLHKLPLQDLPVIARLQELDITNTGYFTATVDFAQFYAQCYRFSCQLVKMLQKYGESNRSLTRVGYTYCDSMANVSNIYKGRIWERFTSLSSHLRQTLTRLEFVNTCNQELPFVCNTFHGLTSIKVSYAIDGYGLVPLFHELSKLKQLIYLWLQFHDAPPSNGHRPLPQLPSVKALALTPTIPTPQHLAALNIGWLFPNLQVIYFNFYARTCFNDCGFNNEVPFPYGNLKLANECLRQVFRPLKRHFGDKLTIMHNYNDAFDWICSAEELVAAF